MYFIVWTFSDVTGLGVVSMALNLISAALFNSIELVIFTFYEHQNIALRIKKVILHFMKSTVFMNVQFYKRCKRI